MGPTETASPLVTPRFFFVFGSLALLLVLALSPQLRIQLGLLDHGRWFLDSYAVLASSDAARAGLLGPVAPNPYDLLQRPNSYSDWWFVLGKIGLSREDNFMVGGLWVLGFLAAIYALLRPSSWGEALWMVLLVASPPVMLGILRANNDLVIFTLLTVGSLFLRDDAIWRWGLIAMAIAIATGLKFYPAAAALVIILLPRPRRMLVATGLVALLLGAVLLSVGAQLHRGIFEPKMQIHTMGARIWLMDLGLAKPTAAMLAPILLAGMAAFLVRKGWTTGLASQEKDPRPQATAIMAGALLLCCFLVTVNHAYRWIFSLWLAPWLWQRARQDRIARLGVCLLPVVLWHDGLLCLLLSNWFPALDAEHYLTIFRIWRIACEPVTWLLMGLLAGWLTNLVLSRWRELLAELGSHRAQRRAARSCSQT